MEDEVIGIRECLDIVKVSRQTLYRYMSKDYPDRIPYWKKGGKVLFDRNAVKKWLRNE